MDPPPPGRAAISAPKFRPQKNTDRVAREAAALRANLLKRKQQSRQREDLANPDPPDTDQR